MITVVITSCGRPDLLERTLDSFFEFNTYPVEKIIVVEDSGVDCNGALQVKYIGQPIVWMCNEGNMGQIASIDRAYSHVKTPYVFHCEEDWQFYRHGFIEESLKVLESNKDILQVWLRERNDTNNHPIEHKDLGGYFRVASNYKWKGFSFNPGLRRMADYVPYRNLTNVKNGWQAEFEIGMYYWKLGYYAVILPHGYVMHIGGGKSTSN